MAAPTRFSPRPTKGRSQTRPIPSVKKVPTRSRSQSRTRSAAVTRLPSRLRSATRRLLLRAASPLPPSKGPPQPPKRWPLSPIRRAEPNPFDPSGTLTDHYTATIDWGDGSTTPGTLTYSGAVGSPTGVFSVASPHTYGEEGVFTITTVISHEASTPQTVISTATVSDPNVIATGGFAFTAVEGAAAASQTVATFTDPGGAEPNPFDPGPLSVDYSATIDWATAAPRLARSLIVVPWDLPRASSALPVPTPMVKRASSLSPPSSATKPQRRRRSLAPPRSAIRT